MKKGLVHVDVPKGYLRSFTDFTITAEGKRQMFIVWSLDEDEFKMYLWMVNHRTKPKLGDRSPICWDTPTITESLSERRR